MLTAINSIPTAGVQTIRWPSTGIANTHLQFGASKNRFLHPPDSWELYEEAKKRSDELAKDPKVSPHKKAKAKKDAELLLKAAQFGDKVVINTVKTGKFVIAMIPAIVTGNNAENTYEEVTSQSETGQPISEAQIQRLHGAELATAGAGIKGAMDAKDALKRPVETKGAIARWFSNHTAGLFTRAKKTKDDE